MNLTGKHFDVILKDIHLKWGTTGNTDGYPRSRHELEVYIPIPSKIAKELNLLRGQCFSVQNCDFKLRVSGSQGENKAFGKNFESAGNLKLLGEYLKQQLNLYPGSKIRIKWISQEMINISKI